MTILAARRTPGFALQRPWLGRVDLRLGLAPPGPVAAPQPLMVNAGEAYPPYRLPPAEPGESQDVQNLALNGARLTVEIGVPQSVVDYYTSRGQAPPTKQTVRALIDTGASISGVKPSVAKAAGLIQTSSVGISGVVGTENRPVYTAAINLPQYNVSFDTMDFAGVELPQQDLDVLLGRDLLRHTVFTFSGKFGSFELQDGQGPASMIGMIAAGGIVVGTVAAVLLFA